MKSSLTGRGTGLTRMPQGYLRIKRGKLRDQLAHRAFMERCIGRKLREDEEVEHLCKNRACWPPTDFHLCLMDSVIHHAISAGEIPHWRAKRVGKKSQGN